MDHLRDEATFLPFFHELIFAAITTALGFLELFCNVSKADLQQDDVNHIPVVQLLYLDAGTSITSPPKLPYMCLDRIAEWQRGSSLDFKLAHFE